MKHANPEIEAAVVGALLDATSRVVRSDVASLLAASGLVASDFTETFWRHSAACIAAIVERRGEVSPLAVWAAIRGMPGVGDGDIGRLESAKAGNRLAKPAVLQHAATLRRLAQLRGLQDFHAKQLAALSAHGADPAAAALELEQYANTVTSATAADETAESDVLSLLDSWDAAVKGTHHPLLETGIAIIDQEIGGWERNLNLLGGLPSMGKSSFLATCIANQLKEGKTLGLFGLEEGTQWFLKRQIAKETGIPLRNVGRVAMANQDQEAYVSESLGRWQQILRRLFVYRRGGVTTSEMVAISKRWVVAHGVECVYVDHGGEVEHEGRKGSRDRDDLAVAHTYRSMRNLALNHSVPVVMLAHFSRDAYESRPTLRSFAHTEEIGRMASTALGLWQRHSGELLCDVVKARNGKRGTTISLARHETAALIRSSAGEVIDVEQEARDKQAAAQAARGGRSGGFR